jgi:hypothetical protein
MLAETSAPDMVKSDRSKGRSHTACTVHRYSSLVLGVVLTVPSRKKCHVTKHMQICETAKVLQELQSYGIST